MRMSVVVMSVLCYLTVCLAGPAFYEATGQTQVFTLTAGAKADWQHDTPVKYRSTFHTSKSAASIMDIVPMANGIRMNVNGTGQLMIFNAAGKRVWYQRITSSSQIQLCNGLYFARFVTTNSSQTTRFTIAR